MSTVADKLLMNNSEGRSERQDGGPLPGRAAVFPTGAGRFRRRLSVFFLLFSLLALLEPLVLAAEEPPTLQSKDDSKKVLIISSYSYAMDGIPSLIKGMQDALGDCARVMYTFMNCDNFGDKLASELFYIRRQKLWELHEVYDLVVVVDDLALDFIRKHRQEFFSGIPVVFAGINLYETAMEAVKDPLMTGVVESIPVSDTVKLATQIFPKASRAVAIIDESVSGQDLAKHYYACQREFPKLQLAVINCSKQTTAEVIRELEAISPDTIVLYLSFLESANDHFLGVDRTMRGVSRRVHAPVFTTTETGIGRGMLGGRMVSREKMGYTAGEMVRKILSGAQPSSLKVAMVEPYYCFDRTVMQRFNISENSLPSDAVFRNIPLSLWDTHRTVVAVSAALFIVLFLMIAVMIYDNYWRRRLNRELTIQYGSLQAIVRHAGIFYWEFFPKDGSATSRFDGDSCDGELRNIPDLYQSCINGNWCPPEFLPVLRDFLDRIIAGEDDAVCAIRLRCSNGYHWERVKSSLVRDERNHVIKAIITANNIDSYKDLEEQFATAVRQNGIVTWVYDLRSGAHTRSATDKDVFGLGMELSNVPNNMLAAGEVHPDDYEILLDADRRLRAGAKSVVTTSRWRSSPTDSKYSWRQIIYTNIFDKEGIPIRAIGTSCDITERKEAEQRYVEHQMYQEAVRKNAFYSVRLNFTTDHVGDVLCQSDEYWKLISNAVSAHDFLNKAAETIPYADERLHFYSVFNGSNLQRSLAAGESTLETQIRCQLKPNSVRWLRVVINLIRNPLSGDVEGYMDAFDIDEEKLTHEVIDAVTRVVYDYMMCICIADGRYTLFSGRDSTGYLSEETGDYQTALQVADFSYIHPEDRERVLHELNIDNIRHELKSSSMFNSYFRVLERDGSIRYKMQSVFYLNAEKTHIVRMRTDVSRIHEKELLQQEALEKALHEARQASRAKSEFLSNVSHEIRTPLNAIIGLSDLGLKPESTETVLRDYMRKINVSGGYLLALICDVVDMAKIENKKLELFPEPYTYDEFAEKIDTIMRPQFERKNINFVMTHSSRSWMRVIMVDKIRFSQIFINLLSNAAKFTGEGGMVEFLIDAYPIPDGKVQTRFTVRDNGIGMSQEFIPKIFETFSQEKTAATYKQRGTGLGMPITKKLVELMGGSIFVKSALGVGSEFVVDMAVAAVPTAATAATAASVAEDGFKILRNKRVLLADDDDINREIAIMMLKEKGMMAEEAENGQMAVNMFVVAAAGYYDAILMDVRMPFMDGLQATRAIRALDRDDAGRIPIIALTANAFTEDVQATQDAGMDGHISKPIDADKLYAELVRVFS